MMKAYLLLLCIATASAYTARDQFDEFRRTYNKIYASNVAVEYRFRVFQDNLKIAEDLNARNPKAKFGVNEFSDMTSHEFTAQYLMKDMGEMKPNAPQAFVAPSALPDTFDWNTKGGVVTPVKNQEQCGSCWAFSATETVESVWAVEGHGLVQLSPQQIVDCDKTDYGCNGGWPYNAYKYLMSAGGQETNTAYPYVGYDQTCEFKIGDVVAKLTGWNYVTQNQSEAEMQQFVYQKSPVSVCVDATTWQTYQSGVVTAATCGTSIDHCVQITGWSVVNGVKAWNVRNSWGTGWGNAGYLWVEFGKDACAIAQVVTVPTVSKA